MLGNKKIIYDTSSFSCSVPYFLPTFKYGFFDESGSTDMILVGGFSNNGVLADKQYKKLFSQDDFAQMVDQVCYMSIAKNTFPATNNQRKNEEKAISLMESLFGLDKIYIDSFNGKKIDNDEVTMMPYADSTYPGVLAAEWWAKKIRKNIENPNYHPDDRVLELIVE